MNFFGMQYLDALNSFERAIFFDTTELYGYSALYGYDEIVVRISWYLRGHV